VMTDLREYAREWGDLTPSKALDCVLENLLQAEFPLRDDCWVVSVFMNKDNPPSIDARIGTTDTESYVWAKCLHNVTLGRLINRHRDQLEAIFRESWASHVSIKAAEAELPATKSETIQPAALAAL